MSGHPFLYPHVNLFRFLFSPLDVHYKEILLNFYFSLSLNPHKASMVNNALSNLSLPIPDSIMQSILQCQNLEENSLSLLQNLCPALALQHASNANLDDRMLEYVQNALKAATRK